MSESVRFERQWFQHYDDDGNPLDDWYEAMVASVRHSGREYATAAEIERYETNPDEWEQRARRVLQLAIDADTSDSHNTQFNRPQDGQ